MHSASRRRFLSALVVTASATLLPASLSLAAAARGVRVSRTHFPQSVASGDPRPDRVLLWTRVLADVASVRLQVAEDATFARLRVDRVLALDGHSDACLKVRVDGLAAGTQYHYRFLLDIEGGVSSPVGRTRTAPANDAEVPVRFAFLSCQDYGGRWYNTLLPLLEQDLDFVLHLGDFIYETSGDPQFQERDGERAIVFDDLDGAIALERDGQRYHAARSLSNYRQLHRTYRTDPVLQAVLERAPLIAIWDDHEFSDDCWQDTGTYHDGLRDERDRERRRNAEQAYFEYLPVDIELAEAAQPGAQLPVARERLFPNVQLWRGLRFGKAMDLLLTDYRSARPDHAIPEDAFPGALAYDATRLAALLPRLGLDEAAVAPLLMPYLDLADAAGAPYRAPVAAVIAQAASAAGLPAEQAQQAAQRIAAAPVALPVLAELLKTWSAHAPTQMLPALPDPATLPHGLPWLALGKTQPFSDIGSRYVVLKASFDLFAALRALEGPSSPYDDAQRQWLEQRMRDSDARFKVVASSVSFASLVLDLADPAVDAPAPMRHQVYLNLDHWDGFPAERRRLIGEVFDPAGGTILLSGDIHASFATQHSARTVEFTTAAVSSDTLGSIIARSGRGEGAQAEATRRLAAALDTLIRRGNPAIRHAQTSLHGIGLIRIDGERVEARFLELPDSVCRQRHYDAPATIAPLLQRRRFVFERGDMRLREG